MNMKVHLYRLLSTGMSYQNIIIRASINGRAIGIIIGTVITAVKEITTVLLEIYIVSRSARSDHSSDGICATVNRPLES
jgi:hypothetical protein